MQESNFLKYKDEELRDTLELICNSDQGSEQKHLKTFEEAKIIHIKDFELLQEYTNLSWEELPEELQEELKRFYLFKESNDSSKFIVFNELPSYDEWHYYQFELRWSHINRRSKLYLDYKPIVQLSKEEKEKLTIKDFVDEFFKEFAKIMKQ